MTAPQVVMSYNQELAAKAGGGEYLSQGGAYVVEITEAKYVTAKTGSSGLEFSVKTDDGLKANYISVYYSKAPAVKGQAGEPISGGASILQAMMGVLRVDKMTAVKSGENWVCPEFTGKKIGLFLQKKLTSKADGSDSYGFEIKVPFNPVDKKTMREILSNSPAQTVDRMTSTYKDNDERKSTSGSTGQAQSAGFGGGYDSYPEANGNGFGGFGG